MIATLEEAGTANSAGAVPVVASLEGVNKNYGQVQALKGVNFRVCAGEVVALLGPNGAGKTTAVKLLLGLLQPNTGKVRVLGGDPTNPENRMRTGAMLQVGRVPETLRVREHIDLFSSYYQNPLPAAAVLAAAGLENLSERKFGDLSGGQRQRVLFALAICGNPDLLFLDEPTVGLDVEARRMLWEQIRQLVGRGKTVLLTTHYLQEADALADRVAVINKGEIILIEDKAELMQKLGRNVLHGHKVAATGEIGLNGAVGEIGGIEQKTYGVRQAGADVFLVPAGQNARDARRFAGPVRIIAVRTFGQALHDLATLPPAR